MGVYDITVRPFGEQAILINWPTRVDETILEDIIAFRNYLQKSDFSSKEWELVAAYNSLTVINNKGSIEFEACLKVLSQAYHNQKKRNSATHWLWKLPVCYEGSFGMDLAEVAEVLEMSVEEVIGLHTSHPYIVYGIGFLPGFMYLGGLPRSLEVPRRPAPRLKVPKGSVGLAGQQTGIYPQVSPGGWNIIGNCPIPIFNIEKEEPCFVNVGDRIQFYPISRVEYDLLQIEAKVGIYQIEKKKWHDAG